jgi:hypothetical protein
MSFSEAFRLKINNSAATCLASGRGDVIDGKESHGILARESKSVLSEGFGFPVQMNEPSIMFISYSFNPGDKSAWMSDNLSLSHLSNLDQNAC